MRCAEIQERLELYVLGDLEPGDHARIGEPSRDSDRPRATGAPGPGVAPKIEGNLKASQVRKARNALKPQRLADKIRAGMTMQELLVDKLEFYEPNQ